jgi:hypothetical protein
MSVITPGPGEDASASPSTSDDIVGLARLFIHAKENNVAYMIGTLVAYQMGLLNFIFEYGVGMCG